MAFPAFSTQQLVLTMDTSFYVEDVRFQEERITRSTIVFFCVGFFVFVLFCFVLLVVKKLACLLKALLPVLCVHAPHLMIIG